MSKLYPQMRIAPQSQSDPGERLDSWKEIARYLNREIRTVQRWEKSEGLPVYRHAQSRLRGHPVYAYKSEIDDWLRKNPPLNLESDSELKPAAEIIRKTKSLSWIAVSLLILLAGGAVFWRFLHRQSPAVPFRVVALTSYSGIEQYPAFSPDGTKIAFTWNGPNQDNHDIYVKFLDGGEPLRLTTHPGLDGWALWSPDGKSIGFARWVLGAPNVEMRVISALGGAEEKIYELPLPIQISDYWPGACWTPDGKSIILPIQDEALGLISVRTHRIRRLTDPGPGSTGDCCPALSPDGTKLAFLRASSGRIWNLLIQPLNSEYEPEGTPQQLTFERGGAENPMWTGDGREVLYITNREGERMLWRVPYDGTRPASPVESVGPIGVHLAISPRGDRLVYQSNIENKDLWRIDLADEKRVTRVLSSSAGDINPQISPDGARVAFVSNRERGWRVWVSDSGGAHPKDVAPIVGWRPGVARWSPDGKQIVFECRSEANNDICAAPSDGGEVRRLTHHPANDCLPSWSRDGRWIYVTSKRSGSFQVWKVPADGTEAGSVQLTRNGGYGGLESTDGYVYFSRDPVYSEIWRVPAGGGAETRFGNFRNLGQAMAFDVGRGGVYYTSSEVPDRWFEIWLCRFSTGESDRITRVKKRLYNGLSVSPDERWILVSAADPGSGDLYMVENFR